ncbi:MAG TPA: hypothetical protein VLV89_11885 [Candidatus Acidoferrum sp.]|nr:hypothetical protein [Candidatus Acidoferrum sp.]
MAARVCPICKEKIPARMVVAYSDTLECSHCHSPLRLADSSRIVGAFFGLMVGFLVWSYATPSDGNMGWILPIVYSFLAYSAAYLIYLMAFGEIGSRTVEPEALPVAAPAAHGQGGGHH